MKHLSQLGAAAILTLALAFSTFAGDAECPGIAAPPPPTTTGQMDTPLIQAVVIVIADMLSLS
jgi:hypothetical protein